MTYGDKPTAPPVSEPDPTTAVVLSSLEGLRFGSIEITIHEGRIVQIERREKQRLSLPCPGNPVGKAE
jgi:hypothetical protein